MRNKQNPSHSYNSKKNQALIEYNQELRKIVDSIIDEKRPSSDDKIVFTAFCVGKAYKTHAAALLLCRQGYGQDAAILVRSLVDLLITLTYILDDPSTERLERYFAYDWIDRKKMYDYCKTKPELLKALKAMNNTLEEVEEQAKLVQEKYKYGKSWSDKTPRQMAVSVGRPELYLSAYKLQSQISHTAPRSMNEYIAVDDQGYTIDIGPNDQWVEGALVAAFDCFYHIAKQYDQLLDLGYSNQLEEISKPYAGTVAQPNLDDSQSGE